MERTYNGELNYTTRQKLIQTALLIFTWIGLGMYLEIFGPTLKDLILQLDSDYEQLALAVSGRTFGWFLGSVLGGVLVDRIRIFRHLIVTVTLLVAAITTVAVPWLPNIASLWIFCFIGGVCEQVVNIGGTSLNLSLWKEKSAAPIILMHMGYGVGSFIVPLYTYPFLAEYTEIHLANKDNVSISANDTLLPTMFNSSLNLSHANNKQRFMVTKESQIEYAYAIAAIWLVLSSLAFAFFQMKEIQLKNKCFRAENSARMLRMLSETKNDKKQKTVLEMINPATCANGDFWYSLRIFVLIFLFMGNIGGCERTIGSFIRSFSIDQLNFSSIDASLLNTSFWTSFSVGRLVFGIVAKWVSVRILIIVESLGVAISAILINIFAANNATALWVLMQFVGFLGAPFWPTGVAFTDYHLELTGVGMTVQILGASIGGIIHLRMIGYLYETYGPETCLYQIVASACLSLVLSISLLIVGKKHGNRFENAGRRNTSDDETISGMDSWKNEY